VIIKKGFRSALFLPQVWDELPKKEVFLSQLCLKAGLPADEWKKRGNRILRI
jgi:AMMECR1 domain-containing protein